MTLKINSICPDFVAKTTEGEIEFHKWLGQNWGVLFSHPKDLTDYSPNRKHVGVTSPNLSIFQPQDSPLDPYL